MNMLRDATGIEAALRDHRGAGTALVYFLEHHASNTRDWPELREHLGEEQFSDYVRRTGLRYCVVLIDDRSLNAASAWRDLEACSNVRLGWHPEAENVPLPEQIGCWIELPDLGYIRFGTVSPADTEAARSHLMAHDSLGLRGGIGAAVMPPMSEEGGELSFVLALGRNSDVPLTE